MSAKTDCINFLETVEDSFLLQHVLHPTRGKSVLDVILTCDPDLVSKNSYQIILDTAITTWYYSHCITLAIIRTTWYIDVTIKMVKELSAIKLETFSSSTMQAEQDGI